MIAAPFFVWNRLNKRRITGPLPSLGAVQSENSCHQLYVLYGRCEVLVEHWRLSIRCNHRNKKKKEKEGALEILRENFIHFLFCGVWWGGEGIAQNAYCSRDIYFQFKKVSRSVILRSIMQRLYESASAIGCQECTTKLIKML